MNEPITNPEGTSATKPGQALAVKPELRSGGVVGAIVPQDAEQAYRMAQLIHKSGMAPRDMQAPEKIVTAIFHGLEVGLKPMQAIQSIAVVNGRPCIWGDAALGLVMGSGLLSDIEETITGEGDERVAVCRANRIGMKTAVVRKFGVADAMKAGLWNKQGPWQQYATRMLQMRARSWVLRDGFPDVLKGLHVIEEVRDHRPFAVDATDQVVTAQEIVEQAETEDAAPPPAKAAEKPAPAPAPPAEQPPVDEPEPPAAVDTSDLVVELTMKAPDGTRPDWIAYYNAVKRKAKAIGPGGIKALREANEETLRRMAGDSRNNYADLTRILDDIEAA